MLRFLLLLLLLLPDLAERGRNVQGCGAGHKREGDARQEYMYKSKDTVYTGRQRMRETERVLPLLLLLGSELRL